MKTRRNLRHLHTKESARIVQNLTKKEGGSILDPTLLREDAEGGRIVIDPIQKGALVPPKKNSQRKELKRSRKN